MPKRHVIVELSPSRIEVAVVRSAGAVSGRAERVAIDLAEGWADSLRSIAPTLRGLVDGLDARGAMATLLYTSPTAAVGVFSCPSAAGTTRAFEAALLALAESADFPLESNPHDVCALAQDRGGSPDVPPQSHTLGMTDAEATVVAMAQWLEGAGLVVEAIIPVEAPILAVAAKQVLGHEGDGAALALYVGEHASVLAGASGGRLKFARGIAIGTESLVESLCREIRPASGSPVVLSAPQAREVLKRVGVPERGQIVMEEHGLTGDMLLPLMQPVLQRWALELRQSLRFGLDEAERAGARLYGMGAGAAVPRLLQVVSNQLGLPLQPIASERTTEQAGGAIGAWSQCGLSIAMLPTVMRVMRSTRRLKRALLVGCGAAAAFIATEAVMTRIDLTRRTEELAQAKARLDGASGALLVRDQAFASQAALAQARQRMAALLSSTPAWDVVMAVLSQHTPASVKLTDVQFMSEGGRPVARLQGRTPLSEGGDSNAVLKDYMDVLASVPLVRACKLGATQRGDTSEGAVQSFEISLSLFELPGAASPAGTAFTSARATEDGQ